MISSSDVEIERSLFLPIASLADVESLCNYAVSQGDASVCVPPLFVSKAKKFIGDAGVQVSTILGFPYGYPVIEAKLAEAVLAMVYGADELELAVNMTALKNNDWQYLAKEINTILPVIKAKKKILKILIEAQLLDDDELIKCCDLYGIAGIEFLSLTAGLTAPHLCEGQLNLVRKHLSGQVGLKAHAVMKQEISDRHPFINRLVIPYNR